MSKLIDITGNRYGMLTVICRDENRPRGVVTWKCKCDCGNVKTVIGRNLKSGQVKSCGCMRVMLAKNTATHHMTGTRLYRIWSMIKARCCRKSLPAYKEYGGRGIKMCDEWKKSFENFMEWAFANGYEENLTIDRIDFNGDYCPENCRWVPFSEQALNRRSNIRIEYNGEVHCLSEWCKIYGKNYYRVHDRMYKKKWNFERAMFEPVHIEKRNRKR